MIVIVIVIAASSVTRSLRVTPRLAKYDTAALAEVLASNILAHVAFQAPSDTTIDTDYHEYPTVLPMLAAQHPEAQIIFLHGSSAARLTTLTSSAGERGLAVTISVGKIDGYVLSLAPFSHSCNYRSAVIFGRARLVTDPSEKLFAMETITNRLVPDRWENSRGAPTNAESTATGILAVEIETASVKIRTGPPGDERSDLKNDGLRARVWDGVVPVSETLGDPVAGPENRVPHVPRYLRDWIDGINAKSESYAESAAIE